jgi:hypothetical protein
MMPTNMPMPAAMMPMRSERGAPTSSTANMSRPLLSVPSGWSQLGVPKRLARGRGAAWVVVEVSAAGVAAALCPLCCCSGLPPVMDELPPDDCCCCCSGLPPVMDVPPPDEDDDSCCCSNGLPPVMEPPVSPADDGPVVVVVACVSVSAAAVSALVAASAAAAAAAASASAAARIISREPGAHGGGKLSGDEATRASVVSQISWP